VTATQEIKKIRKKGRWGEAFSDGQFLKNRRTPREAFLQSPEK